MRTTERSVLKKVKQVVDSFVKADAADHDRMHSS